MNRLGDHMNFSSGPSSHLSNSLKRNIDGEVKMLSNMTGLDKQLYKVVKGYVDPGEMQRPRKLAAFQIMALEHALSFPGVERVVYSTCSIHQTENEDVISSVLPFAISRGFKLGTPFPQWTQRGLPVIKECDLVDVVVPFMGDSISDGTLTTFLKYPGDKVDVDEPIAQIETDKVLSREEKRETRYEDVASTEITLTHKPLFRLVLALRKVQYT
ncbi:hypothetical protein AgCh_005097 [Apium graveolens]